MGTRFQFVIHAESEAKAEQAFQAAARRIDELNARLSDYLPGSEVSLLSSAALNEVVPVSEDLWKLLTISDRFVSQSHGAFDPSIGPAVKLWRRARRQEQLPTQERIQEALQAVGWSKLRLDPGPRGITMTVPGMSLDFGGIAKGYAVDEVLGILAKHGIRSALVVGGGDVRTMGLPPDRPKWRVEVRQLRESDPSTREVGELAISTSGDMHQSVEIDGQRYSHIVDPKTGLGLTVARSASVTARDSTTADALATICTILSPKESRLLLEKWYPEVGTRIIEQREGSFEETIIGPYPKEQGLE